MSIRGCARASARGFLAWLLAALAAGSALAQAGLEPLILEVSVNQQRRGEITLYRDAAGEFHARPADLGVAAASNEVVPLRALGARELRFDEARLTLEMVLPAAALAGREFDLQAP